MAAWEAIKKTMCGRTQRSRFADELCSFAWTLATPWAFSGEILHSMRPVGHGTGRPNLGQVRDAPLPASGAFCIACSLLSFSFFFFSSSSFFWGGEGFRKDEGEAQMHEACWLPWGKCGTGRRMPFAVCRCRSPRLLYALIVSLMLRGSESSESQRECYPCGTGAR